MKRSRIWTLAAVVLLVGGVAYGQSARTLDLLTPPGAGYRVSLQYELGFAKVLANTIQIGKNGSVFDYVTQGGEEILSPFMRYQAELTIHDRSHLMFLYQPLLLQSQSRVPANTSVTIDDVTFAPDANLDLTYSFPFWRVSYLYDVVAAPRFVLGLGGSLQLRNASIRFQTTDGSQLTVSQNLGLVPILKARARYTFSNGIFLEGVADGFYASSAFFNGASFDFTGSILDASLRAGLQLRRGADAFVNVRFIGGTAAGTSQYSSTGYWSASRSTYSNNKLATLELTLGAAIH